MSKKKTAAKAAATKTPVAPLRPLKELDNTAAIPIGGLTPPSTPIQRPTVPDFPPDVAAALHDARDSGRYMIAVWRADEVGTIHLFRHTSGGFLFDWWLRALTMFRDMIVNAEPPPASTPAQNNPAADE